VRAAIVIHPTRIRRYGERDFCALAEADRIDGDVPRRDRDVVSHPWRLVLEDQPHALARAKRERRIDDIRLAGEHERHASRDQRHVAN
jgi:hypothetical protein